MSTELSEDLAEDLAEERAAFNADDDDFDLFRAAALLGRIEDPRLDVGPVLAEVEALAERVRDRVPEGAPWPAALGALVEVLFHREGFAGDDADYDAPQNSFLHRALERRRGLPITLSVLTCEVARRAGIDAYGIGFPGHFLVGVHRSPDAPTDLVVIDPFHKGQPLGPTELEDRLARLMGRPVELTPEHLEATPPAAILVRMLTNLRGSYARRKDNEHLVRVLSRLLLLKPAAAELLCERALARRELLDSDGARADAERALSVAGGSEAARERARRLLAVLDEDGRWVH